MSQEDFKNLEQKIFDKKLAEAQRFGGQYLDEFNEVEARSKSKKEAEEKFFQLGHKTHENALKEATELNPDDKFYMLCQEIYYHHDEQTRVIAIAPDERTAKELVSHIRKHYKNNFKEKGKYSFYLRSNDGKMIELDKGIEKQ